MKTLCVIASLTIFISGCTLLDNISFFILMLLRYLLPILVKLLINGLDRLILGNSYKKLIEEMLEKLKNNQIFINSISKIMTSALKIDSNIVDKIAKIPEVQKLATEVEDIGIKDLQDRKKPITRKILKRGLIGRGVLAFYFGETFVKAWKNPSIKNPALAEIKNRINLQISQRLNQKNKNILGG